MGAGENGPSRGAECLDEVLENEHRSYVEAGERFVQNEHIRIVHKRGDQEDTLAHTLGIRAQRNTPMRKQREKLEERAHFRFHSVWRHGATSSNHLQIFLAGQQRVETRLFRDIALPPSIRYETVFNLLSLD